MYISKKITIRKQSKSMHKNVIIVTKEKITLLINKKMIITRLSIFGITDQKTSKNVFERQFLFK